MACGLTWGEKVLRYEQYITNDCKRTQENCMMEMFWILTVVVTQMYAVITTQERVHLKWVHFIVGKLHLNKADFKECYPGTNHSV